jgi:biopolymer transport protein ExbD
MFRKRFRRHREVNSELNITAFMNLMVVLVPFLLITAVFSQVSVLKLNLPGSDGPAPQAENDAPKVALEIIFQPDQLLLNDRNSGLIKAFPWPDDASVKSESLKQLNGLLRTIKARFPEETTIAVLNLPDSRYEDMIAVMDAARQVLPGPEGEDQVAELFPDISIGRAPVPEAKGEKP